MAAKTVGFAIAEEDTATLDSLVNHYGHGNRSEFLRVAMKRLARDLRAERMQEIQAEFREATGGRIVSRDEVLTLIRNG